jgi:hypothetical protein
MSTSKTFVTRVSGSLEGEDGIDHSVELDLEVLEMFVNEISGVAKRQVTGIRDWHGAKLPDEKYTAKFPFEGKMQRLPQRMVKGILRNF